MRLLIIAWFAGLVAVYLGLRHEIRSGYNAYTGPSTTRPSVPALRTTASDP